MARRRGTALTSGRVGTILSILFGLFVLFDIALFGWLILKSLSQREIEKILIETREEAEPLARQLAVQADKLGQEDLFVVVSVAEETKRYLGSVLLEREIVRSIKIRDRDGTVVYEQDSRADLPARNRLPRIQTGLGGSGELEIKGGFETEVPIGEMGSLVIGISEIELQRRIGVLRGDLVRQATLIGAITVTLFGAAFVFMRVLFRRADHLEKQAAEAERMAMIGALASGLAHEIRNPLNSLNLNMQMLEEEVRERDGSGSQNRLLGITRKEIGRLENLVTDFLSYARPRPLELVEVGVKELLERAVEVLEAEVRAHGAEVRILDAGGGRSVRVDLEAMTQLLLNLLKNALAAIAEVDRKGLIVLEVLPRSDVTAIEVRDNGGGIPPEHRPNVFDLFFSTRKGGTGLGLAIVERIARSHGAGVEVESVSGQGTTIRLLLPR